MLPPARRVRGESRPEQKTPCPATSCTSRPAPSATAATTTSRYSATSRRQAAHLEAHPSVVAVVRDTLYQVHTTHSSSFLGLSPSSGVQAASNGATDAVIALIDTGIYPKDRASFAAAEKISWRLRVDSRVQWHGLLQQQAGGRQDVLRRYEEGMGHPIDEKQSPSP
jgi:hypothetical protein